MSKTYFNSKILIRMVISFLFTYLAFPFLYKVIFDVAPYFNSYIVVFPLLYALLWTLKGENRFLHFLNSLKTGLIMLLPGFVLSFFYTPGLLAYFVLFYYFDWKEHEKEKTEGRKQSRHFTA